jgi:predicted RNA-binding protein with PUA-like domain
MENNQLQLKGENMRSTQVYKEFIGEFRVHTQDNYYDVRCWREENDWDKDTIKRNREAITTHIAIMKGTEQIHEVAEHLLSMDRMNAVEVSTHPKENGCVFYFNWP